GGGEHPGLREVVDNLGDIDARAVNSIVIDEGITLRVGKYGPYLEVEDGTDTPRRVNVPEGVAPDELTPEKARELIDAPVVGDRVLGAHPETGKTIVAKDGRYGPYVTELEPEPEAPTEVEGVAVDPATGEVVEEPKPKKKAAAKKAPAV